MVPSSFSILLTWHLQGMEDLNTTVDIRRNCQRFIINIGFSNTFFILFLLQCRILSKSNVRVTQLTFEKNEMALFCNTTASFFQVQQSDSMLFHSNLPVLPSIPLVSATLIISCCHCQGTIVISAIQQHTPTFLLWHHHLTADLNKVYLSIVLSPVALLLSAASSARPGSPASSFHQL